MKQWKGETRVWYITNWKDSFGWGRNSSWGTGFCSLVENMTSQGHNNKNNNNRTTDQGQHMGERQSEEEGFSTRIWLQVKPGSNTHILWDLLCPLESETALHNNLTQWGIESVGYNEGRNIKAMENFPAAFDPELTAHAIEGKRWEEEEEWGGGESERYGLVTFNLVALHIAILHFTYDGDIQDNNDKNNQGRQVNRLSPQRRHKQWEPKITNRETGKWLLIQCLCDSHIERFVICKWCDVSRRQIL